MKKAAIFLVLATVCCICTGVAADSTEDPAIANLKSTITRAQEDLTNYAKELIVNLKTKLQGQVSNELSKTDGTYSRDLTKIKSIVAAANRRNKSAHHCLKHAEKLLDEAKISVSKELEECSNKSLTKAKLLKSEGDSTALQGNNVRDGIRDNSPKARRIVKAYERTIDKLKRRMRFFSSAELIAASRCNNARTRILRTTFIKVRLSTKRCASGQSEPLDTLFGTTSESHEALSASTESVTSSEKSPEASSESPEASSESPEASSESPETSSESPEASSESPETSSESSEASSESPEASSESPEASSESPETSSESLEASSETPETSSESPEASSESPEVSSESPEASSEPPEISSESPEASSESPEASSESPEASSESPEASSESP